MYFHFFTVIFQFFKPKTRPPSCPQQFFVLNLCQFLDKSVNDFKFLNNFCCAACVSVGRSFIMNLKNYAPGIFHYTLLCIRRRMYHICNLNAFLRYHDSMKWKKEIFMLFKSCRDMAMPFGRTNFTKCTKNFIIPQTSVSQTYAIGEIYQETCKNFALICIHVRFTV